MHAGHTIPGGDHACHHESVREPGLVNVRSPESSVSVSGRYNYDGFRRGHDHLCGDIQIYIVTRSPEASPGSHTVLRACLPDELPRAATVRAMSRLPVTPGGNNSCYISSSRDPGRSGSRFPQPNVPRSDTEQIAVGRTDVRERSSRICLPEVNCSGRS